MNILLNFLTFAVTIGFAAYCHPKKFIPFSSLLGSVLMGISAVGILFFLVPMTFTFNFIKNGTLLSAYTGGGLFFLFATLAVIFAYYFYRDFKREQN